MNSKFQAGKSYFSAADSGAKTVITVDKREESNSLELADGVVVKIIRLLTADGKWLDVIRDGSGNEYVYPFGRHTNAPVVSAADEVNPNANP